MDSSCDFEEVSSTSDDSFSRHIPMIPANPRKSLWESARLTSVSDPPETLLPSPPPQPMHPPSALRRRLPGSKPSIRRRVSFELDSCGIARPEKIRREALSKDPELEDTALTSDLVGSEAYLQLEASVASSEATSVLKSGEDGDSHFALFVFAFIAGILLLEGAMTKPAQVTRELPFDYTKATPDAFVVLGSCGRGGFCAAEGSWRLVPLNLNLQATIDFTFPESDYNCVLDIFQVKVEFLSADGKVISSSSQPCMLLCKSSHIRLIETFLKCISLLSGYSSE